MASQIKLHKGGRSHQAWLYSVVFASKLSVITVLFLFASFLVQPFHKAMANGMPVEEPVEEQPVVADDVKLQKADATTEENTEAVELETDTQEDQGTEAPPEQVSNETVTSDEDSTQDTLAEDEFLNEEDDALPVDSSSSDEDEDPDVKTNKKPLEDTVKEIQPLVNDSNYYQFSKQSCVAVGDGTFHCSAAGGEEIDTQSVVYSAKGENGSLEIFLRTSKGKVKQITEDKYDDTSPHYDAESMRVVWQRLINDRYQIVVYDVKKDEEQQLTFSRTNNMEPKVSEAGIVWQAWDGNDWEIMYFDGTYTDQITDNTAQDVTPVIEDGYILWSVLGTEEQEARVYSLDSKETLTISGHEGGAISNPRFVLVYDTKFDNGDIVTQGFDPATGLSAPIAAKPAQEPIDIPKSDPIGEIRALLQNKSSHEDEFTPDPDNSSPDLGNDMGTTTITSDTLNLKSPSDTIIAPLPTEPVSSNFELTEYDLVVTFDDLSKPAPKALKITATSTQE